MSRSQSGFGRIKDDRTAKIYARALESVFGGVRYVAYCSPANKSEMLDDRYSYRVSVADMYAVHNLRISTDMERDSYILPIEQCELRFAIGGNYPPVQLICQACFDVLDKIRPGWSDFCHSGVGQRQIQVVFVARESIDSFSCPINTRKLAQGVEKTMLRKSHI